MATETTQENQTDSKEQAATILANQYFNNASVAEALSLIPLNTLLQLVQNQVVTQARSEVETMTEDQVADVIKASSPEADGEE